MQLLLVKKTLCLILETVQWMSLLSIRNENVLLTLNLEKLQVLVATRCQCCVCLQAHLTQFFKFEHRFCIADKQVCKNYAFYW